VGGGVAGLVVVHVNQEVAEPALFEHAHQVGGQRLLGGGRHLVDLAAFHHERTVDRLEVQVARDLLVGHIKIKEVVIKVYLWMHQSWAFSCFILCHVRARIECDCILGLVYH